MRSICKNRKDKDKCGYIKRGKESDCIGVQDYDAGYEAATEKACEWLIAHFNRTILSSGECVFEEKLFTTEIEEEFRKAMEEAKNEEV